MISKRALARWSLLLTLLILVGLLQATFVNAAGRDRLRWVVGCDGFTSQGGGIILNRDNTGEGREVFTITAMDGNGTVIFGPVSESSWVGAELFVLPGVSFDWHTAPAANPIRLEVVSPAGNGWDEQIVYATLGNCVGLEFVAAAEDTTAPDDFTPSASVPLNGLAPRPTNPDNLGVTESSYLIVTHVGTVNLRSGDGVEYTVVGKIAQGEYLRVIGRNDNRSWWFVQVGDIRGWINGTLVAVRGDLTDVPVIPVTGELDPPRLFIFTDQVIYGVPTELAVQVCEIPGGLEYEIVGRNRGGTWYEIAANCGDVDVTGWIEADAGAFRSAGLPIPVTD
jgi:hypothetical protein